MEGQRIADLHGRAGWRIGRKILVPHQLELVEIGGIDQMHFRLEHAVDRSAGFSEDPLESVEAMPRLYFDQRRTDLVLHRV